MTRIDLSDPAAIRREGAAWPWRIAFLVFAVLLLVATHWPGSEPSGNSILSPDKLMHFLCFGGFTFLLWMTRWFRRFWVVAGYSMAFTVLDEISQGFFSPYRDSSGADIVAGLLGVFAASAWMTTFQPANDFVVRQQERRVVWILNELLGRPANWFLLGAAFVVPMLIVFLPLYILGWSVFGISIGNISLTLGILIGTAAVWGVLRRLLPDQLRRIETDRPCFDCGTELAGLELDEHGSGHCGSCGHPVHASQWHRLPVPRIPLATVLQADGPLGLVCIAGYVLLAMFIAPLLLLANGHPGLASAIFYTGTLIAAAMAWQWHRVLRNEIAAQGDRRCIRCEFDLASVPSEGGLGTCPKCGVIFARLYEAVDDEVVGNPGGMDTAEPTTHG